MFSDFSQERLELFRDQFEQFESQGFLGDCELRFFIEERFPTFGTAVSLVGLELYRELYLRIRV